MGKAERTDGVWITYSYDYIPYLDRVWPDETAALYGKENYQYHMFLPYGLTLQDALRAQDKPAFEKDL